MCLSSLKNDNKTYTRYKIFIKYNKSYRPLYQQNMLSFKKNIEYCDKCGSKIHSLKNRYPYLSGFHIFKTKEGAKFYIENMVIRKNKKICKVKYSNILVSGYQKTNGRNLAVDVAYKITILEEIE